MVADRFAAHGVTIVDTDVIAREVVAPGQPALAKLSQVFGSEIIDADGSLDRRALRKIVFADEARRRELESILHPLIRETAFERASQADSPYVVVVVPLLYESPMRDEMDRILVVDCDEETQLGRLLARDGETEAGAKRMIAAQASREQRLSIADDVVDNSATIEAALAQVDDLHGRYLEIAAATELSPYLPDIRGRRRILEWSRPPPGPCRTPL